MAASAPPRIHPGRLDPAQVQLADVQAALAAQDYVSETSLTTAVFLALRLQRPLLLEGEAGVGKTEVAKVLAAALDRPLIRLQCYEGLDVHSAVYEWNYARQMLEIRLLEATHAADSTQTRAALFGPEFLLKRPLLQAIDHDGAPPVLLIDELDRADEEFEAFLLEVLSDFQVTIPELGVIRANEPPIVVITSNRTREVHDALRRRCIYHWIDYPDFAKELEIVRRKAPRATAALAAQVVAFVQTLRNEPLYKAPGLSETLDWIAALLALEATALTSDQVDVTLGTLLKYRDDVDHARTGLTQLLSQALRAMP